MATTVDSAREPSRIEFSYYLNVMRCWSRQVFRNGWDIARVLDITQLRRMPAGLVGLDHPWVTGVSPHTGRPIWHDNIIYRSPRGPSAEALAEDDVVISATARFLAHRVRQSAVTPELPIGPKRRMPHAVNYMHGSSHYNSGIILLTDLEEGYRHATDPRFRAELRRFVREERREVLFIFRSRDYTLEDYANLSCCMRSLFPWFCNPNGPKQNVLWGNASPFPAANLITGHWADDVYRLFKPGGSEAVIRPPIAAGRYFQEGPYDSGRSGPLWPERLLARLTHWRVKMRGEKGNLFFVDRRKVYADQIARRRAREAADTPVASRS